MRLYRMEREIALGKRLDLSALFSYTCVTMAIERIEDNQITSTLSSTVDSLLDVDVTDIETDDFMRAYGVTESDVVEFRQRKADYQSGEDTPIAWEVVKKRYGII